MEKTPSSHTQSKVYHFSHRWVIDDFSHFYVASAKRGYLDSVAFSPSANPNLKLRFRLHPKGVNWLYTDFVSLAVMFEYPDSREVSFDMAVSLIGSDGQKKETKIRRCSLVSGGGFCWREFVSRSSLRNLVKGYLPNDKLTILCEVSAVAGRVTINEHNLKNVNQLWAQSTMESLDQLMTSGKWTDVSFVFGEMYHIELSAHKAILAARSPVFANMFECEPKDKLKISDVDIDVFRELLLYIYTGKINAIEQHAENLLVCADKYKLDDLKKICENFLLDQVNPQTARDMYDFANRYNLPKLMARAQKVIQVSDSKMTVFVFRQLNFDEDLKKK